MRKPSECRVLVACEFSGTVRDAFIDRGFNAISCDLLPCESTHYTDPTLHYQGNVMDILSDDFDLMIAFPPCTFLCSSGLHWNKKRPERALQTEEALTFVQTLMDAPIKHIAIENPIGCISTRIRKPDCKFHPYHFGHPESKATCLWLKNLPPLQPTNILNKPASGHWSNQTPSGQNKLGPSADRWKLRSITYSGVAQALASQYGDYICASD